MPKNTPKNPIVDEVRKARAAYAAKFNYDMQAIYRDLKEQEQRSGRPIVPCAENNKKNEPSQPVQTD